MIARMKKMIFITMMLISSTAGFSSEEITFPPKPPETTTKEMVNAGKGLVRETKELGTAIVKGVKDDGGIIATLRKHKKFYGSIFIFFILSMLFLRNRSK